MLPDQTQYPVIVLFGPPGCGKGTQANLICEHLGMLNLSVGSSVRQFVKDNSQPNSLNLDRANRIEGNLQSGELLHFDEVKYIVESDIKNSIASHRNILIEGLPRTPEQAQWLAEFFDSNQVKVLFFHFLIDEDQVLERLSHRYYAPGSEIPCASYEEAMKLCQPGQVPTRRKDDMDQQIIKHRYDVQYASCKVEILETMNRCQVVQVINLDASPSPDFIFEELVNTINSHAKQFSTR